MGVSREQERTAHLDKVSSYVLQVKVPIEDWPIWKILGVLATVAVAIVTIFTLLRSRPGQRAGTS